MKLKRKSDGAIVDLEGEWSEVKPEEWEDVTGDCFPHEIKYEGSLMEVLAHCGFWIRPEKGLRFKKVRCGKTPGVNNPDWAFIIEMRKS